MRIGVLARPDVSKAGNQVWMVNDEIKNVILKYQALPVVILPTNRNYEVPLSLEEWDNLLPLINSCDGFILQGGDQCYPYDLQIVEYLLKRDIPVFGICLGMQTMSILLDGELRVIEPFHLEHHQPGQEYVHIVKVYPNTNLYRIFKTDTVKVNSRHKECIVKTKAKVCAASSDNIIEGIEVPDKTFFIGVQWHPESMIEYDKMSNLLFDEFFHSVRRKYERKQNSAVGECD